MKQILIKHQRCVWHLRQKELQTTIFVLLECVIALRGEATCIENRYKHFVKITLREKRLFLNW